MPQLTRAEHQLRLFMQLSAAVFAMAGGVILAAIAGATLFAGAPLAAHIGALAARAGMAGPMAAPLALSMMATLAALAYFAQRNIRGNRRYVLPLLVAQLCAALASLWYLVAIGDHLGHRAALAGAGLGWAVTLFLYLRAKLAASRDTLALPIAALDPCRPIHSISRETLLDAPRYRVYRAFVASFESLLPDHLQTPSEVTKGQLQVGARYTARPRVVIRPILNMEITRVWENREIVCDYLAESPLIGWNSVEFDHAGNGTRVAVALRYQLDGIAAWLAWHVLGGKRYYHRLLLAGFDQLRAALRTPTETTR